MLVADRLILLDKPALSGKPVVGDAEFESEAGRPSLQERRVCPLQVVDQSRFDVVGLSYEKPLPGI